jgi:hypothetical protein
MLYFDPVYLIVSGICIVLSLLAAAGVKATFARYSQVMARSGVTGAQVAAAILQANGITDVTIEPVAGKLTDHYDPSSKTLRLSEVVYGSNSVSAVGVAAHEVGHAIQHQHGYWPLNFRSAWVPVAGIGTNIGFYLILISMALGGFSGKGGGPVFAWLGLALFGCATVFTLITLPVEFNASRRALQTLEHSQILTTDELSGARNVLVAAALTYVAAFAGSLLQLLYWAYRLGLFGQRRSD